VSTVIWSGGRYTLLIQDRGVMGPGFVLGDDEYGQAVTAEELAGLRDVLIAHLGAGGPDIPPAPAPLERLAALLEKAFDPEKQAFRLYDVERKKVYTEALAPEVKAKFGMEGVNE